MKNVFLAATFAALSLTGAGVVRAAKPAKPAAVTHTLVAQDRGHVVILDATGKVTWETACGFTSHDIGALPNGNFLLHTGPATIVEMTPEKQIVWQHTSRPVAPYNGPVEIHAFQRLRNGITMISETGNLRIIEVDKDDKIVHETPLTVDHPNSHRDTRRVRKLDNGHYLVCHEGDGKIREYDPTGKVVWTYTMDLVGQPETPGHDGHGINVFNALRLKNGDTLIAGGNNNRVFEVTPEGKNRLEHRARRTAGNSSVLGHVAASPAEWRHYFRQHPRRPEQSATNRSDPRQKSRVDNEKLGRTRQ